jgi:hypothetical protein
MMLTTSDSQESIVVVHKEQRTAEIEDHLFGVCGNDLAMECDKGPKQFRKGPKQR